MILLSMSALLLLSTPLATGSPLDPSASAPHLARKEVRTNTPNCVGELPSHLSAYPEGWDWRHWATLQSYCLTAPGGDCTCEGVRPGIAPNCAGAANTRVPQWIWAATWATTACRQSCRCGDGPQIVPPDFDPVVDRVPRMAGHRGP